MDPLSVAGSVAGLVSLGDAIFRKLYHYIKDVKNAEKEIQNLKNEVATLNGVLHNLRLVAEDLEIDNVLDYSTRVDHVKSCLATLYKLDAELNKIGLTGKGKLKDTIRKLNWPFKSVNTKQFIEDIRQHRNNLSFALSADSMTALIKCLSNQTELLEQVANISTRIRDRVDVETRIEIDAERQSILNSFLTVDPYPGFKTSLQLRHPTTGFWLSENETFKKWLREPGIHIWLSGIPGAGKTVLSSLIIQACMDRSTADRAVAFYYCDYKDLNSQKTTNILGSLASQLARQNESSYQLLKSYYEVLHPKHQLQRSMDKDELIRLLQDISNTFEDVRIVVDGLDECGNNSGEAIRALASMAAATVSLSLLSRDEFDIREVLRSLSYEHIEISAHTEDLQHYVRSEIEERIKTNRLRVKSSDLKEEIVIQLVSRAQGM
jgi:hypothetical protein